MGAFGSGGLGFLAVIGLGSPARPATVAAQAVGPEVHVIATGGTIAARGPDAPLSVDQMVAAMPGIERVARITVEQFANIPSSQITPAHWRALARRIDELFRSRPGLRGIVLTHGTDTMEETALFLHLTVTDERPVVVTGAMRPPTALAAEGPANLRAAIETAIAPGARGRGTLVVMNDEIFSASDVAKHHTSRLDAFVAPAGGRVGVVDGGAIIFHGLPAPPPIRFDLGDAARLPRVDIVSVWAGADGVAIEASVAAGARGIVIASVGRGNMPEPFGSAARRAAERGVIVVVSSRTGAGRIPVDLGDRSGLVGAGALNPQRARVVLMLALARGDALPSIARLLELF